MDTRPLILVDVDGPLNPYDAKPTRRPEGYKTIRVRPRGWEHTKKPLRVWLNESHGPALLKLAEDTGAELVWATTWRAEANVFIGPEIGLPELPWIDVPESPLHHPSWKYDAVLVYVGDRPLVWFDDDFRSVRFVRENAAFVEARGDVPTRLHFVDPRIGLTELDFSSARTWLTKLSG